MEEKEIAIICDGREISFGLNLKHLFNFDNRMQHYSVLGSDKAVEIYTPAVFKRENITRKAKHKKIL